MIPLKTYPAFLSGENRESRLLQYGENIPNFGGHEVMANSMVRGYRSLYPAALHNAQRVGAYGAAAYRNVPNAVQPFAPQIAAYNQGRGMWNLSGAEGWINRALQPFMNLNSQQPQMQNQQVQNNQQFRPNQLPQQANKEGVAKQTEAYRKTLFDRRSITEAARKAASNNQDPNTPDAGIGGWGPVVVALNSEHQHVEASRKQLIPVGQEAIQKALNEEFNKEMVRIARELKEATEGLQKAQKARDEFNKKRAAN